MSRTCVAIPNGPGSWLLAPRPRRSTAASETASSTACAIASHERLVDVIPWIASTTGASALWLPSLVVASEPPATGTSIGSVMHRRACGPVGRRSRSENDVEVYVHGRLPSTGRTMAVRDYVSLHRRRWIAGEEPSFI